MEEGMEVQLYVFLICSFLKAGVKDVGIGGCLNSGDPRPGLGVVKQPFTPGSQNRLLHQSIGHVKARQFLARFSGLGRVCSPYQGCSLASERSEPKAAGGAKKVDETVSSFTENYTYT